MNSVAKKRGGSRPGAGRKPGVPGKKKSIEKRRVKRMFTIAPRASQELDRHVPLRKRSEFVSDAILEKLKKIH